MTLARRPPAELFWVQQQCGAWSRWQAVLWPEPYPGACGICGQPREVHSGEFIRATVTVGRVRIGRKRLPGDVGDQAGASPGLEHDPDRPDRRS